MPPKKIAKKFSKQQPAPRKAVAPDPIPVAKVSDVDTSALDKPAAPAPKPAPAPAPKVPEVPVSKVAAKADMVQFMLNVDISPPPVIGIFDFEKEMRISVLKAGKYTLPRSVATRLQGGKYGQIIG